MLKHPIMIVLKKEFNDIIRDTRALLAVSLISILAGPFILLLISNILAEFESRAERRIIVVHGIEHAPSLANHLARETTNIEVAPEDYAQALQEGRMVDPVLVIPSDFEEKWLSGEPQTLTIMTNSSNSRINAGVGRVVRWVNGIERERASITFALRGVSPSVSDYIQIKSIDLASAKAKTAKLFAMLPYFLVLAALYGVWGSALDTTVGERERGTLEPLLVTPHPTWQLMLGKWCAITLVGCIITSIAILSFIPAQWLMQSETLKTMFNFGRVEVIYCLILVLPLTGLFASMLMLVGTFAKNTRQAQANASVVLLISTFLPILVQIKPNAVSLSNQIFPLLAQHHHILALFKGGQMNLQLVGLSVLVTLILSAIFLGIAIKKVRLFKA